MRARRALERRRLAFVVAGSGAVAGAAALSHHADRQRRPLRAGSEATAVLATLDNLHSRGVGVMHGVVHEDLVQELKGTAVYRSMPTDMPSRADHARNHAGRARDIADKTAEHRRWRASAMGRLHCREEAFERSDVEIFERVEKQIWPLVTAFFSLEEGGMEGVFRSEMQILNAVPGSKDQTWHCDNTARGLSVIVPLVDFNMANGATQLLPGSHARAWPAVLAEGAQIVCAPVGAAAAYDSRTLHRGLGNETAEGRPALIFCYDRAETPPPGGGTVTSIANANLAHALNVLATLYAACRAACTSPGNRGT